jgi:recombination protein RecT
MANDRTTAALANRDEKAGNGTTWEQLVTKYRPDFQQAMPEGREATQLVRDALHCIRTTKGLSECDRLSVLGSLMTCAQLGLRPGVANLGEAWLIPFKGQATLIVGYRGFIKLAYNSAQVLEISGRPVRANEPFECSFQPSTLLHRPVAWGEDPGDTVGYYAAARLAGGGLVFETIAETEAEAMRQTIITAPGFRGGPWRDWPEQMKIKTAVRRLFKWLPTSLETEAVQAVDGTVRTDPSPNVRPEDASTVVDGDLAPDDDNPLHGQEQE